MLLEDRALKNICIEYFKTRFIPGNYVSIEFYFSWKTNVELENFEKKIEIVHQVLTFPNILVWSHLLKISLIENFIFCAVYIILAMRKHKIQQFHFALQINGVVFRSNMKELKVRHDS